jgi:predicted permease
VNPPLIGALLGAIISLTPALHRLFFSDTNKGGYLNAWLTHSAKNIGDLFASLQIIVVCVKLSQSLRKMKKGEESDVVPRRSMTFITCIRFIL